MLQLPTYISEDRQCISMSTLYRILRVCRQPKQSEGLLCRDKFDFKFLDCRQKRRASRTGSVWPRPHDKSYISFEETQLQCLQFIRGLKTNRDSAVNMRNRAFALSVVDKIPSQWERYKLQDPCRSRWTPRRYLPSCTPPARGRTCDGWRTAADARWCSWCTAARTCCTANNQHRRHQ